MTTSFANDTVARLRQLAADLYPRAGGEYMHATCASGADEIERLTREYKALSFQHEAVLLANRLLIERDAPLHAEVERLRAALEDLLPEIDAIASSEWKLPIDLYSVHQIKRVAAGVSARIRQALRPADEHKA